MTRKGAQPIPRVAARVVLLDPDGAFLLIRSHDPDLPGGPTWWHVPGGGLDPGETPEQAAVREIREEVGVDLAAVRRAGEGAGDGAAGLPAGGRRPDDVLPATGIATRSERSNGSNDLTGVRQAQVTASLVGAPVGTRITRFTFGGLDYVQEESFFVVRLPGRVEVVSDEWTDLEKRSTLGWRWWTVDELGRTGDTVYPPGLGDVVGSWLAVGPPGLPRRIA